eukprot:1800676-Ditylum_brightwellii.AAC.1
MGVKKGVYSPTLTCKKAVVSNHFIREAGWKLDYVARWHGGLQSFWFPNGACIPLEYNTTWYKLYIRCCKPTPYKLRAIMIQWINCHIEDLDIDSGTKPIQQETMSLVDPVINHDVTTEEEETVNKDGDVTQTHKEKGQESIPELQSAESKPMDEENPIADDVLSDAPN